MSPRRSPQVEVLKEDATSLREELRHTLHSFAALAEEGDMKGHQGRLEAMCVDGGDGSLDDFFRKSGGLKAELTAIHHALGEPILVYPGPLDSLRQRVDVVVSVLDLSDRLEELGKQNARRNLQATLEKLRTGRKAEIAGLVPQLRRQVSTLAQVSCIPPEVSAELVGLADRLEVFEKHTGRGGGGGGGTMGTMGTTGAASVLGSTRGGGGGTSVVGGESTRGSELGGGGGSGGGSRAGGTTIGGRSAAMSGKGSVTSVGSTHLVEVRGIQKRLGYVIEI